MPDPTQTLIFDKAAQHRALRDHALSLTATAGYREAVLPTFEPLELFEQLYGSSIRQRLMTFTTDRTYALRPDLTAGICRVLRERPFQPEDYPLRFSASGSAFRHERVRPLRRREFHQFGLERIDTDADARDDADVEAVTLAQRLLIEPPLSITQAVLRIGHAGLRQHMLDGLGLPEAERARLDSLLDLTARVRDRFDPPCGKAEGIEPAQHPDAAHICEVAIKAAQRHTPLGIDPSNDSASDVLERFEAALTGLAERNGLPAPQADALLAITHHTPSAAELARAAAPLLEDPDAIERTLAHLEGVVREPLTPHFSLATVRSIGYYSDMIFEIDVPVLGPDAGQIIGGGRYDKALEALDDGAHPARYAVGFAVGLERLLATYSLTHPNQPLDFAG